MKKTAMSIKKYGGQIGLDLDYFLKNSFWVAVRQGSAIFSGLFLAIIFARVARSDVLGQYQLVLSILAVVSIFSVPGLNTSIIRAVSSGRDGDYRESVRVSFFWSLLGVPVLLFVGSFYYFIFEEHALGLAFFIASVFFPFLYAPNTWDSFLQGKGRFDILARYSSFQMVFNAILTVGAVFLYRESLLVIIGVYFFSYTLFNIYFYFKSLRYIENQESTGDTMSYGWFLTKINILGLVADNLDKILIGVFLSPSMLAVYYVISVLPLKIKDAIKPFFGILYPKLSGIQGGLITELSRKKSLFLVIAPLLGLSIILYVVGIVPLSRFLFGDLYIEYYGYSLGYAILLFVLPLVLTVIKYVQIKKYNEVMLYADTAYAVVRIFLSTILIYYFGLLGAVVAYNFSVLLWLIFYVVGIQKKEHSTY